MPDFPNNLTPLEAAREFTVMFLAFTGRDHGTRREAKTIADLQEMATKLDGVLRAAIAEPNAGTSAYQMVADTATAQLQTTETLIHMVAATVLMKVRQPQEPVVSEHSVTFSPTDMDEMHRRYEMTAKHDGMLTTVHIKPRPDEIAPPRPPIEANLERKPESLMTQDDGEGPFKPQAAPHVYDRPIWAIRFYVHGKPKLHQMDNQGAAERQVRSYLPVEGDPEAVIENRFCLHVGCPADRCLLADAEVTSE